MSTAAPSAPEGPLETYDITATTVGLTWKPPNSDGGKPITKYIIEKRDAKRMGWTPVEKIQPNATSYTVQNLTTGADFYFRIIAENEEGVSPALETTQMVRPTRQPGKHYIHNNKDKHFKVEPLLGQR